MRINFLLILVFLSGCTSQYHHSQFYTWVDESGNLRSEKRQETMPPEKQSKANAIAIDSSKYISSDELELKLKNTRLYSWQDTNGKQMIIEESPPVGSNKQNLIAYNAQYEDHMSFREGISYDFTDIKRREIKLADFYSFNKQKNKDYLLIKLDERISIIQVKSFIGSGKASTPLIVQLNAQYQQTFDMGNIWNDVYPETWHGYGYLNGEFSVKPSTSYLLIMPDPNSQPIKIKNELIKKTDLGLIVLRPVWQAG